MIMDANSILYTKGVKSARLVLKDCIKEGIIFSAELIVLSILLLIYGGMASVCTVVLLTSAIVLLIATIIARAIFVNKVNIFHEDYPESKGDSKDNQFINASMSILKMGTYTAIINIITTTVSLITVCALIIEMMN